MLQKLIQKIKIETVAAILLVAMFLLNVAQGLNVNQNAKLRGAGTDVSTCFGPGGAATTTGITYLHGDRNGTTTTGGATTTLIANCPINGATELGFNFIFGGTTTPEVNFTFSFSDDGGTWFYETNQTLSSNDLTTIGGASTTPRRYTHGGTGTTTKQIPLIPVAARYLRLQAKANGGSGGYIWVSVSKREGNN